MAADGFWQPHRLAPSVLTEAVLAALEPSAGERAFDLFCGVGLFTAALVDAGCRVWGVEGTAGRLGWPGETSLGRPFTPGMWPRPCADCRTAPIWWCSTRPAAGPGRR